VTRRIGQLKRRIETQVRPIAPRLLELPGCAGLTAAKIIAETAGAARFRSSAAFAMHAGTAPIPVWTGNRARYRLNRGGNRQLNAALHRIAVTQLRIHPPARSLIQRRIASGNDEGEAGRSAADEIFEGVMLEARREHEERKMALLGKMVARFAFRAVYRSGRIQLSDALSRAPILSTVMSTLQSEPSRQL
jgi:Transposase IS116/IS110/IS902 family